MIINNMLKLIDRLPNMNATGIKDIKKLMTKFFLSLENT